MSDKIDVKSQTVKSQTEVEKLSEKTKKLSNGKKSKSIFRTEAFVLIIALVLTLGLYFSFFFTLHLKWLAEKSLSKVYGAEVNIGKIHLGYNPPSMSVTKIEFTNHQSPYSNLFEIGNISFKFNTRELMFMSIVTEEASITEVKINSNRSHKGFVSPESQKLISLNLNLKENKKEVIAKKTQGNILENALSFSKSKDLKFELEKLGQEFKIDDLLKKYESRLNEQTGLFNKYKNVVKNEQLLDIETKLKSLELKINNKASALEVIAQGKELLDLVKTKKNEIEDLNKQFKLQVANLKSLKSDLTKDIDDKKQSLKNKFKIPDISADSLAKDFFAETVNTRFYLFKYWLDQIRKNSEEKIHNIGSKVLSDKNSAFIKEKIKATLEASKNEKSIKEDIEKFKLSKNQIVHFGSNIKPKFWIKKSIIKGDAKKNQDLQNFIGEILNVSDDQKIIGMPISIKFQGDLPKDNIYNMKISALLNHHIANINETFTIAANYPISSFKIIDDDSLKLYLKKASTRTNVDGVLLKNEINNLTINNSLTQANFLFNSSKSDFQKILSPIFSNINSFNVDVSLNGPINNPDLSIVSSLSEKISTGLKSEISAQLNQFNFEFEKKLSEKTVYLQKKIFSNVEDQESKINSELQKLDLNLETHKKSIDQLIKKSSSLNIDKLTNKLTDKLLKKKQKK